MGNNKVNAKKAVMIGCGFVGSASVCIDAEWFIYRDCID